MRHAGERLTRSYCSASPATWRTRCCSRRCTRWRRAGELRVPVVGVALTDLDIDGLRKRAAVQPQRRRSRRRRGGFRAAVRKRLTPGRRRFDDPATFTALAHSSSGTAKFPAYYLAVPPSLFGVVAAGPARRRPRDEPGWWWRSRSAPTWPSARALDDGAEEVLPGGADLPRRPLPRQGVGGGHPRLPVREHAAGADLEQLVHPDHPDHHGGELRRGGPRLVLRPGRRDPRRGAEPPAPGARAADHGAAGVERSRRAARREVQGAAGDPAGEGPRHGARPVRRVPDDQGGHAGQPDRDVRGREVLRGELALAQRADQRSGPARTWRPRPWRSSSSCASRR